jgi:hypothetical protein
MFQPSRRALFAGAAVLVPGTFLLGSSFLLSGCTSAVTFAQVQGYVATAVAAFDKLGPLVEGFDPAIAPQMNKIIADVNAAGAAFAALTAPTGGAGTAQMIISLIEDGLTLAMSIPGIPPQYQAIMAGIEVLLVAVGSFFGLHASPPSVVALAHPGARESLRAAALATYNASADKAQVANDAQAHLREWLAS